MKRIITVFVFSILAAATLQAQPNQAALPEQAQQNQQPRQNRQGGFAAPLSYPVVYEGPDVVFRQIDENLWVGSGHVMASETLYIVAGNDSAVLIDTGTSIPGLDKIVESIIDKPYKVILTHVHPDHAGGCGNFSEVWLAKPDEKDLAGMAPDFKGKVHYLKDGDVIDLGGRTLEVVNTPGHTPGSVTFMDKANHYGFSGDAFGNGNLLLLTDFSTIINTCTKTLEYMQANDIYYLYNGHFMGSNHETTKRIWDLLCMSRELLAGEVEGEKTPTAGIGGLDHVYTRDGLRLNYGSAQMK